MTQVMLSGPVSPCMYLTCFDIFFLVKEDYCCLIWVEPYPVFLQPNISFSWVPLSEQVFCKTHTVDLCCKRYRELQAVLTAMKMSASLPFCCPCFHSQLTCLPVIFFSLKKVFPHHYHYPNARKKSNAEKQIQIIPYLNRREVHS